MKIASVNSLNNFKIPVLRTNINCNRILPFKNDVISFKSQNIDRGGFKSKEEIIEYFSSLGINVIIDDFSDKHLETFNLIRDDIKLLKKMGLSEAVPKDICLSDWRDIKRTRQITSSYGLNIAFPPERRAYCGASSGVIFINSSEEAQKPSNGVFKKFKHEIGHKCHYTYSSSVGLLASNGSNSVLGQGVNNNIEFANRQLKVLGINESVAAVKNISAPYQITAPIQGKYLPLKNGIILNVDTKNMTDYMNSKCHCYNKNSLSEQVAEIFEDLLKGRKFDDLIMLMYDFAGGGRIPNLIVNGKIYDDYIISLYENKELVKNLKKYINISNSHI